VLLFGVGKECGVGLLMMRMCDGGRETDSGQARLMGGKWQSIMT
jgi:hypothetical protein